MKKLSIIGDLVVNNNIIIEDENGIPVTIFPRSKFPFICCFNPPSILVDNIEKLRYKNIEIKIIDVSYLNKLGYRLVSVKTNSKIRNFSKQYQSYMLEAPSNPIPNSLILNKVPKDHFIEYDVTNNRVRIKGRNVFPYNRSNNTTPWKEAIKK
jgi:hypothetical protein